MSRISSKQIINILVLVVTIVINGLANALPLNGKATGEISDQFPIYFVPAGYVFSIWGLIYLALIAFVVFQALPSQRDNPRLNAIFPWFVVSNIANTVWLFFWHYEIFPLTIVAMLVLLFSLLKIYTLLRADKAAIGKVEWWLVIAPFSIYLGWVSVATVANASQLLYYLGWNGFGISPIGWTIIMLIIVAILTLLMLFREKDVLYALVILWALAGIANKQAGTLMLGETIWIIFGILVVAALYVLIVKKRSVLPTG